MGLFKSDIINEGETNSEQYFGTKKFYFKLAIIVVIIVALIVAYKKLKREHTPDLD